MSVRKTPFAVRLHTVFGSIFFVVLLLPLSGMYFFRIYEGELVRQTESELIAEGVFISAMYKDEFRKTTLLPPGDYGNPVTALELPADERYRPFPPQMNLNNAAIYPPRPDPISPPFTPDPVAQEIGKKISPILLEAKTSMLSSMRVVDPKGTVVAGTSEEGLSLANIEEISTVLTGRYISLIRQRISDEPRPALASLSRGTEIRLFVALPIVENERVIGAVYLSRSPRNVLKALYEERDSVFAAGLFVVAAAAAIAALLAYMIGRPLTALTRHAQQLSTGDWKPLPVSSTPIEEIASLNDSFGRMSSTIQARSEYIRSFAMHLAHEFKTPLTAIQGAIELMHDHANDMTPEQRERFMENITKDTGRMKALVSRLLELARADMLQPGSETADVGNVARELQRKYAGGAIISFTDGNFAANIGSDILDTVLTNLVENSLQHGARNIIIGIAKKSDMLELHVIDDGEGITEGNAPKVFTPFFTTKREKGGTGLGLVITRSLLKAHGGDIEYMPSKSGAQFRVTLKAAG
ncbi:MAG: sensor histidine kinase [Alphaproteobacteria bacterium]